MKKYASGEKIEPGDHITTDGGCDQNVIMHCIDKKRDREDFGLDCFGCMMSSTQAGGIIFVSFDEICSQDTTFIRRKVVDDPPPGW